MLSSLQGVNQNKVFREVNRRMKRRKEKLRPAIWVVFKTTSRFGSMRGEETKSARAILENAAMGSCKQLVVQFVSPEEQPRGY